MASFFYLLLVPLLLFSISLSPAPALCYINPGASLQQNSTEPSARQTYIVLVEPPSLGYDASEDEHRRWHESFLPSSHTDSGEPRLTHSYTEVISGFATRLTDAELNAVSQNPGFVHAFPDRTLQLMTTHTPEFLGLRNGTGFWSEARYGKGIIVGLLDSGIHATHRSFDDHGVPPPPTRWKGSCKGFAARCNNKLIGAKSFVGGKTGDDEGHGTHTSSTAAGNFVTGASANGLGAGIAAGVAPLAHIAMYKVCIGGGCELSAILAGLDAATKDGVDVISLSLGSDSVRFDDDPIAIGTFSAVSKGIIVVCAAGNSGPWSATVSNDAPWLLTVAAGSVDRSFHADVQLANGKRIDGQALTQVSNSSSKSYPLLYSKEHRDCHYEDKGDVAGKIVVCEATDYIIQEPDIRNMRSAGVAGVVLFNRETDGYTTNLLDYGSSVVQVTAADGKDITDYATSVSKSAATIAYNNTLLGIRPAPDVAFFSSRGPSLVTPGVLKPDILAPGLNILAAWPPQAKGVAGPYNILSGTSMATPHVSGVAALIKSSHPDWSPAAIKSAILTTSDAVNKTGGLILDEQHKIANVYATGTGHVNPTKAADPGLVYNLGVTDYVGYICSLLGNRGLAIIVRNSSLTCAKLPNIPEEQLNYPTITVPWKSTPFMVNRTVTNVGPAKSPWFIRITVLQKCIFGLAKYIKWFTRWSRMHTLASIAHMAAPRQPYEHECMVNFQEKNNLASPPQNTIPPPPRSMPPRLSSSPSLPRNPKLHTEATSSPRPSSTSPPPAGERSRRRK